MQQTRQNIWIPLLIAGIILAGLVGSLYFPPFVVWGGITVAMFGAILLGHPQQVLFLFWMWASFRPLIRGLGDNFIVKGSNGLFVVALIGICMAGYAQRRTVTSGMAGILKIFTSFAGCNAGILSPESLCDHKCSLVFFKLSVFSFCFLRGLHHVGSAALALSGSSHYWIDVDTVCTECRLATGNQSVAKHMERDIQYF